MASFQNEGTFSPDRLVIGEYKARKVILAAGQGVRSRGDVIGKKDADGEYLLSAAAATDGSEKVDAILAETVDTAGGPVEAVAYIAGTFDVDAVVFGAGHTAASADRDLRMLGFFLEKTVG